MQKKNAANVNMILGRAVKIVNRHFNPTNAFLERHEPNLLTFINTSQLTISPLRFSTSAANAGDEAESFRGSKLIGRKKQRTHKN